MKVSMVSTSTMHLHPFPDKVSTLWIEEGSDVVADSSSNQFSPSTAPVWDSGINGTDLPLFSAATLSGTEMGQTAPLVWLCSDNLLYNPAHLKLGQIHWQNSRHGSVDQSVIPRTVKCEKNILKRTGLRHTNKDGFFGPSTVWCVCFHTVYWYC